MLHPRHWRRRPGHRPLAAHRARPPRLAAPVAALLTLACVARAGPTPGLPAPEASFERDTPLLPLPAPPPELKVDLAALPVRLTPEKVRLGRWLFFDPRLSADGTVACASCHLPEHAFSDPSSPSRGVGGRLGIRRSQPVFNAALRTHDRFFWDGRAASLSEQALGPITNPVEMASTAEGLARALGAVSGYRRVFGEVYGDPRIDAARVADALAAYQFTLFSAGSPYDRYEAGDDGALSPLALDGLQVFFGRGRCNACHLGQGLSDGRFHNAGVGYRAAAGPLGLLASSARRARPWGPLRPWRGDPLPPWEAPPGAGVHSGFEDSGRFAITGAAPDLGAFKTPTLRDLPERAPYMHDGSSPDLEDAVLRYLVPLENPWLDPAMAEVQLVPADVAPLLAFLRSLEAPARAGEAPRSLPR